jgi:hypothetical protein
MLFSLVSDVGRAGLGVFPALPGPQIPFQYDVLPANNPVSIRQWTITVVYATSKSKI